MTASAQTLGFSGVVLAGGHSLRMGTEKALLEVDGVPLWRRQHDLLGAAGVVRRWVSLRENQAWLPADVPRVNDSAADCGPMGGLSAALALASGTHLIVLAVDLPQLPLAWLQRLQSRCLPGRGAVGVQSEGTFEPLAAIYPSALDAWAAETLRRGELSLQKWVRRAVQSGLLEAVAISAEERGWFENWNTPGDRAPAVRRA